VDAFPPIRWIPIGLTGHSAMVQAEAGNRLYVIHFSTPPGPADVSERTRHEKLWRSPSSPTANSARSGSHGQAW
jgi:hypothetical protein